MEGFAWESHPKGPSLPSLIYIRGQQRQRHITDDISNSRPLPRRASSIEPEHYDDDFLSLLFIIFLIGAL